MRNLLLVAMLVIGVGAMAQKPNQEKRQRGYMNHMDPEQMATLQTKRMTLALDLTNAQQKQIQSLNLENATKRAEKIKEMKAKKETGELKRPTSEERYNMQLAILDHQIDQKKRMKNILDKEQYAKWEKMKTNREGHQKEKMTQSQRKSRYGRK